MRCPKGVSLAIIPASSGVSAMSRAELCATAYAFQTVEAFGSNSKPFDRNSSTTKWRMSLESTPMREP